MTAAMPWATRGVYDTPLTLNLAPHSEVIDSNLPRGLVRALTTINSSERSTFKLGYFSRDEIDFNNTLQNMSFLTDEIDRRLGRDHPLSIMEREAAAKIVPASGRTAFAYFMSDAFPWDIKSRNQRQWKEEDVTAAATFLRYALRKAGYDENDLRSCRPSFFADRKRPLWYKKGSSYGCFPYVQGSSPINPLALIWHTCNAVNLIKTAKGALINQSRDSYDANTFHNWYNDSCNDLSTNGVYMRHPYGAMMISRARPLGPSKQIPDWQVDKTNRSLTANTWAKGFTCGTREIKPNPAGVNIMWAGVGQALADAMRCIEGFHVGHQVQSPHSMRSYVDVVGHDRVVYYADDKKAFDNTVNIDHLTFFCAVLTQVFGLNDWEQAMLKWIDEMPIITKDVFDNRGQYTVIRRANGVPSGFILTTPIGTLTNFFFNCFGLATLTGRSFSYVLDRSYNSAMLTGKTVADSNWGQLVKGDDSAMVFKRGFINEREIPDVMAEWGLNVGAEPGTVFLSQYIDTKTLMVGSQYPYCPAAFLTTTTFKSHGFAAKRIGNRGIFVEHPISDPVIARMAVMMNLQDMVFHPVYSEYKAMLLDMLNKYDSNDAMSWTEASLWKYLRSERGKQDMQRVGSKKDGSGAYVKEMFRRFGQDGSAVHAEGSDNSVGVLWDVPTTITQLISGQTAAIRELASVSKSDEGNDDVEQDRAMGLVDLTPLFTDGIGVIKLARECFKIIHETF